MTTPQQSSDSTVITVADEQHPFAFFRNFFSVKNNILITLGIALIVLYFFFAFGAVKTALSDASSMMRHNRGMAKEYKHEKQSKLLVLSKLDSLDKNKFDKILIDSISDLKDTVQRHRLQNDHYSASLNTIREKYIHTKEDITILRADLQNRMIEVEQLKAQQEYDKRYYSTLSVSKDSLAAENYKLQVQLQTLRAQLSVTTNVKK